MHYLSNLYRYIALWKLLYIKQKMNGFYLDMTLAKKTEKEIKNLNIELELHEELDYRMPRDIGLKMMQEKL